MKRVLVVDDSRSARMIFVRCLKIVGYGEAEFVEASDGHEALELLAELDHVDLVMLDLNMPKMDGLSLLDRLKHDPRWRDVPVVVATSLVNDALRARLFAEGVHAVVEKPISPVSLIAAVAGLGEGDGEATPDGICLDAEFDRAVRETFEGMAFTSPTRLHEAEPRAFVEPVVWARLAVLEPAVGELVLVVAEQTLGRLEETVTGSVAPEGGERHDLLGELLNALAGRWARMLAPDGERILLSLPRTGRGDWDAAAALECASYETDDRERILVARFRPVA